MSFHVDLNTFRGPLDLLLYLVRKHEVEVTDIPIAVIAEQFLAHIDLLEELNVDDVGEFIELASTLLEIKAQTVLPRGDEEEGEIEDPRDELVHRLLEYKKYKDAASMLEEQSRDWQQRYARLTDELPPRQADLGSQPIQEVELWDLVSAFGRIMRDHHATEPANIVYDDTPIQVYMRRIHDQLITHHKAALSEMFEPGMHKSAMIGVFLAILELVRHHSVVTDQQNPHGEIWVVPGDNFRDQDSFSDADSYAKPTAPLADSNPAKPR